MLRPHGQLSNHFCLNTHGTLLNVHLLWCITCWVYGKGFWNWAVGLVSCRLFTVSWILCFCSSPCNEFPRSLPVAVFPIFKVCFRQCFIQGAHLSAIQARPSCLWALTAWCGPRTEYQPCFSFVSLFVHFSIYPSTLVSIHLSTPLPTTHSSAHPAGTHRVRAAAGLASRTVLGKVVPSWCLHSSGKHTQESII